MKCRWYEEQVERDEVQLWSHGRPSSQLLAHARNCTACEQLVNRELQLRELFIELAETSQRAEPSDRVRQELLAQVGTMQAAQKPRRKLTLAFALAAAALICAAVGLAVMQKRSSVPSVAEQKPSSVSVAAPNKPEPLPAAAAAIPTKPPVGSTRPRAARTTAQRKTANDFYPTVMCDSLTCAGPSIAVRVQVPASPLLRPGVAGGTVTADLLVGEDGVVRGVRVLE